MFPLQDDNLPLSAHHPIREDCAFSLPVVLLMVETCSPLTEDCTLTVCAHLLINEDGLLSLLSRPLSLKAAMLTTQA
jgi:hypothetical protein